MFIGDYKKFVFYSEIYKIPLFNKEGFCDLFKEENYLETHMPKFVNEIVNSQNFMHFLMKKIIFMIIIINMILIILLMFIKKI